MSLVPDSVDGLVWCATFALELGDLAGATAAVAEVARLGADATRPTVRHLALSRRSTLAAVRGDTDEALALAMEAYDLATRCGLPDAGAVLWGQLFAVWRQIGLDDEHAAVMERLLRPLVEHSSLRTIHEAALVQVLHARGDDTDAHRRHDELVALAPTLPYDMVRVFSLVLMAENCVAFQDLPAAVTVRDALVPYADRFAVAAGAVACLGSVHVPLSALAGLLGHDAEAREHRSAAQAAHRAAGAGWRSPSATATVTVERGGAVWEVRRGTTVVRLPDTRGLAYLATLVSHPGRDIPAQQLIAGAGVTASADHTPSDDLRVGTGADPVLDRQAASAYRRRLADLEEEFAEARSWHDEGRLDRLQQERDALVHELASAFGLGGRPRRLGSEAERARLNATRAIRTAIRNIAAQAPDLGAALDAAVVTGTSCRYNPDRV
ncbi:MAG: hypothetical protein ABJA74_14680 [Lapillicoccus sp.]